MPTKFTICFAILAACAPLAYADWPDWRGPTSDGRSDATGLPLTWSETQNIAWKVPIHDLGHSTPIVWGDQIWLTTATRDGSVLYAVCFDLDTGEIVHNVEIFQTTQPQHINPNNSYATPSVVVEAGRVYAHFGTLGTACIDSNTGEVLWRREDLHCNHMQGPVSSPVLYDQLLILHYEGVDTQFIAALDKTTGKTVWLHNRSAELYDNLEPVFLKKAYHTPIIVDVYGEAQLLSNGALLVTGHEPRTGKELWHVKYGVDSTISRIVTGNGIFFVNCGGAPGATQLWAVREGGSGDVTDTHVIWKMTEDVPLQSSPVLVDDLLYTISDSGTLVCTEAKTGERVWAERLSGKYGASLLYADNRIYICNMQGKTTVIEPGRRFKVLAENELDGGFWASPAVAGKSLLLRTKTHLYRIQND